MVFVLASCNDEFLDRLPETSITEDNFWNTEQDLIAYNNQLYATYYEPKGFGSLHENYVLEGMSDNAFSDSPSDLRLGVHSASNPITSISIWNWNWELIRNINVFLENYKNTLIDESIQNKHAAEARLLRALSYYDKVKLYGNLPLIDKVLSEDDELVFTTQSSRNEIIQFIIDDLNFAVQWLPEGAPTGKFSKNIALAYKARITLHEGTFRKYHGLGGESPFLQAAANAANEVIASEKYQITSDSYFSLFNSTDLLGNKEVVFYKDYDETLQIYHNIVNSITNVAGQSYGGTKSLINDYLCTDGLSISDSPLYQGDEVIANEFINRDLRLSATFASPNDSRFSYFMGNKIYLNSSPNGFPISASPSGYHAAKFFNDDRVHTAAFARDWGDYPLFRYAEVLLIYAEAKKELGSLTQGDIDISINLLRTKAGVADMTLANASVNEIRRERRVELALEGMRYDDLMRWKQGPLLAQPVLGIKFTADNIADYHDYEIGTDITLDASGYVKSNSIYDFDENKHYYFPIPINELSLNPNLVQTNDW